MRKRLKGPAGLALAALLLAALWPPPAACAQGGLRVLQPKFTQSGHVPPGTATPPPRSSLSENMDVAVLFAALCLASFLALRARSRRGIYLLTLFSLGYFGFYRRGCVCPVGSIQNMTSALSDGSYAVPYAVIAFFALPLIFTLFFGRTFCAAVCPLGAIQELVVIKPVRLPVWVRESLGLLPPLYLALAVALAATGTSYIICRYDPFVGFFRTGGPAGMIVFGVVLLIVGVFIGRPYCRFLCPYGVLLGWCSRLSKWHVTITPDDCIQCRLCEDSCPYDAIRRPSPRRSPEPRAAGVRRLLLLCALAPFLVLAGGFLGSRLAVPLSRQHKTVALAERVSAEDLGMVAGTTLDSETFRRSPVSIRKLVADALAIRGKFISCGRWFGGFMGLIVGGRLLRLSVWRRRDDYVPDTFNCVSCARCFGSCPVEHQRLKLKRQEQRASAGQGAMA